MLSWQNKLMGAWWEKDEVIKGKWYIIVSLSEKMSDTSGRLLKPLSKTNFEATEWKLKSLNSPWYFKK